MVDARPMPSVTRFGDHVRLELHPLDPGPKKEIHLATLDPVRNGLTGRSLDAPGPAAPDPSRSIDLYVASRST
jgi:hypothetical protein